MFKYKSRMKEMTPQEMNQMVRTFSQAELKWLSLEALSKEERDEIDHCLKIIILCDRYNKGEPAVRSLDFTLIRNILNRYNTKNLTAFLSIMANSFLFVAFYI